MFWAAVIFLLNFAVEAKATAKTVTLDSFIQKVLASGRYGELPERIANSIKIPENAPYRGLRLTADQTSDEMNHNFKVLLEKTSGSNRVKPVGLELDTIYKWPGNHEGYLLHVSLDGKLENASYIHGKTDAQGNSVKGSGRFVDKDINSSEIKDRFKHELDLWLKKTYLKKEWRSAEIVEGELKKKS